jgi:hypothetical protein
MSYDPEATIQDADIELAEMVRESNRLSALKQSGVCIHDSTCGLPDNGKVYYPQQASLKRGQIACFDCDMVWDSEADYLAALADNY